MCGGSIPLRATLASQVQNGFPFFVGFVIYRRRSQFPIISTDKRQSPRSSLQDLSRFFIVLYFSVEGFMRLGLLLILPVFLIASEYMRSLGELGSIHYTYDQGRMLHIDRLTRDGDVMYTHSYGYDEEGRLVSEQLIGDLGKVIYEGPTIAKSPYNFEQWEYNAQRNVVWHIQDGRKGRAVSLRRY